MSRWDDSIASGTKQGLPAKPRLISNQRERHKPYSKAQKDAFFSVSVRVVYLHVCLRRQRPWGFVLNSTSNALKAASFSFSVFWPELISYLLPVLSVMCAGLPLPPSQRYAATTHPTQLRINTNPSRHIFHSVHFSFLCNCLKISSRIASLCSVNTFFFFFSRSSLNPHKVGSTFTCVRETDRTEICRWWVDSHSGRLSSAGLFLEETPSAAPSWAVPLLWLMPPSASVTHTPIFKALFIYVCLNLTLSFILSRASNHPVCWYAAWLILKLLSWTKNQQSVCVWSVLLFDLVLFQLFLSLSLAKQ